MVPIAHGGNATAYRADVQDAQSSPLTDELFNLVQPGNRTQFVFIQNGEPGGLYCADETDGESIRVCDNMGEALLSFKPNSADVEAGGLASAMPTSNSDLTEWTFSLRPGAKFSDGTPVTARDVVMTFAVQWDAANPLHKGRTGDFEYWSTLFGGYLNTPPAKK